MFRLILIGFSLCFAVAAAAQETDLKAVPKPDDTGVRKLETELNDTSLDEEVQANDAYSYDAAAKGMRSDAKKIETQIVVLKKQTKALENQKTIGQQHAAEAQKELERQQKLNVVARARRAEAFKQKQAVDQQNAKLNAELTAAQNEEKATLEETRKLETFIRMAQDERKDIINRINQSRARTENQKRQQKAMQARYEQMRKSNRALASQAAQGSGSAVAGSTAPVRRSADPLSSNGAANAPGNAPGSAPPAGH